MSNPQPILLPTRQLSRSVVDFLQSLKPGQRLQITQSIRVGAKKWKTTAVGVFRGINYLATGVTTERVPEDDIVMPMLHFTKDNGELSSIAIDENSEFRLA
jgi:hypothetical protein